MAGGDLPQTGETGRNVEAPKMFQVVALEVVHGMRSWSHNAHIAFQDVQQLREFVNAVYAQKTAHTGDPGIIGDLKSSAIAFVQVPETVFAIIRIGNHGAEFEAPKPAAFAAYSPGPVQDRAFGIEFGGHRSYQHDWRGYHQNGHRNHQV